MVSVTKKAESEVPFKFRSGHRALDLTATVSGRKRNAPSDALKSATDLGRWIRAAGLGEAKPDESDLALARSLREAIYGLVTARVRGVALPKSDRLMLNAIAAGQGPFISLSDDGVATMLGSVRQLLTGLALEALLLIGGENSSRLRQCEGESCAILFLDESRTGERRWCSMASCGNRAKVRSFRERSQVKRRR
jgi:predicted RNA-binding Zn ribbon-like protein